MNLHALHEHRQEDNRIAVSALRTIAKNWHLPYPAVRGRLIDGDYPVTAEFWRLINSRYPNQFVGIDWYHCCRKFTFKIRLAS